MLKIFCYVLVLSFGASAFSKDKSFRGDWLFSAPSLTDGSVLDPKTKGDIYFNTTLSKFYGWNGSSWIDFGGGANTTLSNLGTTAINADLLPASSLSMNVGSQFLGTNNVWSRRFQGTDGSVNRFTIASTSTTMPSGVNVDTAFYVQSEQSFGLTTASNQTSNANPTKSVRIETGNKEAGTGNSGDVILQIGTSLGGTRGKIRLLDGTEGTTGHIWTSTNTSGSGRWSEVSSPSGTMCGWNDGTLTLNCKGVDPATACPTGYTQRTAAIGAVFCSAN